MNEGGVRITPGQIAPSIWPMVEVLHTTHSHSARWERPDNLWMYMARGTGVWFHPGRVLVLSDAWDLAIYLNATSRFKTVLSATAHKTRLMQEATQRLAGDFDSIAFVHHIDGGCCHRMVMRELVSLRNFTQRCPVSPLMRRGWAPDDLRPCTCNTTLLHPGVC